MTTTTRAAALTSEASEPGFDMEEQENGICTRADVRTLKATWHAPHDHHTNSVVHSYRSDGAACEQPAG